jgi:CO dehydrogenase nickel-insertion accessory protein CooC1
MKIVIINGKGGCGKDTFVTMCKDVIGQDCIYNISTVDFVKEVAEYCGWDGTKTPENRKFLSDLKDLLTEWDNVPFKKIVANAVACAACAEMLGELDKSVVFIHCREPKEIQKLVKELGAITLLIRRDAAESVEQMNHADNEVLNYEYDYTIPNNGSLSELRARAEEFLRECLELKF